MMETLDPVKVATDFATYDVTPTINRLEKSAGKAEAEKSSISSIATSVSSLMNKLNGLTAEPVLQKGAELSSESFFTVSVAEAAELNSYKVFVEQLAQAQQSVAAFAATEPTEPVPSSGELVFRDVNNNTSFSIDLSSTPLSLESLVETINEDPSNPDITASLVVADDDTYMVFSASNTGTEHSFTIEANTGDTDFDDAFDSLNNMSAAVDAVIWLGAESTGIKLESQTNSFNNIEGLDINLIQAQASGGTPVTMKVINDYAQSEANLNEFVSAYNQVIKEVNAETFVNIETGEKGPLAFDLIIADMKVQMSRDVRGKEYENEYFYNVGLQFNSDGTLFINSTLFQQAQLNESDTLEEMLVGVDGLYEQLQISLSPYNDSNNGTFTRRIASLDKELTYIEKQIARQEQRYEMLYNRYLYQFSAANQVINQMNSISNLFIIQPSQS